MTLILCNCYYLYAALFCTYEDMLLEILFKNRTIFLLEFILEDGATDPLTGI